MTWPPGKSPQKRESSCSLVLSPITKYDCLHLKFTARFQRSDQGVTVILVIWYEKIWFRRHAGKRVKNCSNAEWTRQRLTIHDKVSDRHSVSAQIAAPQSLRILGQRERLTPRPTRRLM